MSDEYAHFVKSLSGPTAPVCLDHHLYRCFTQQDISTSAAHHSASLMDPNAPTPQTFARVAGILEDAGGALVVGEWSGALNPGSLQGPINEREERARYIAAQLALFEQHCTGWFFWTYRKQGHGDHGWSFRDAVEAGVFPYPLGVYPNKNVPADDPDRAGRKAVALDQALGRFNFGLFAALALRILLKANILPIGFSTEVITNIGGLERGMNKVGKTPTDFFYTTLQLSVRSLSSDSGVCGRRRGLMSMALNTALVTVFGNMVRDRLHDSLLSLTCSFLERGLG